MSNSIENDGSNGNSLPQNIEVNFTMQKLDTHGEETSERNCENQNKEVSDSADEESEPSVRQQKDGNNSDNAENNESEYQSTKKNNLRKGKWTPEEEKYTNKVIEVFNAGLLKLGDNERGITLRAYLADKLQCDPMRITKKYTGAACLGKRVYHFDYQQADNVKAEKLRQELVILENNFKLKLEQMSRKKNNEPAKLDESYRISTPGIDALLQRSRVTPSTNVSSSQRNTSNDVSNIPAFHGYPPHLFAAPPPGYVPHHPHFFPMQHALYGHLAQTLDTSNAQPENFRIAGPASSSEPSAVSNGAEKKQAVPMPPMISQFFRGPNGELYLHPTYPAGFSPYFMAMPPYLPTKDDGNVPVVSPSFPIPFPSLPPGYPPTVNTRNPSWRDIHAAAQLNSLVPTLPTLGVNLPPPIGPFVTPNIPIVDVASLEPKAKRPRNSSSSSNSKLESTVKNDNFSGGSSEDELLNRKIELSEVDQNEAATSLLGFINHVKRNSSQEDLAEFYEGVHQKSAHGAALKSPNPSANDVSLLSMSSTKAIGMDIQTMDS